MRWRPVPGWADRYEVSEYGDVRSLRTGKYRKPQLSSRDGHLWVMLYRSSKGTGKQISHMVLEAFDKPRPKGKLALHYDDDPLNNSIGNLRWGTYSENQYDKVRNGNHHNAKKTHCKHGHTFDKQNTKIVHWNGRQLRQCKACHLAQQRAKAHERKRL